MISKSSVFGLIKIEFKIKAKVLGFVSTHG